MVDGTSEYPPLKFTPEDQSRVERPPLPAATNRKNPPEQVGLDPDQGSRYGREWHRPRDRRNEPEGGETAPNEQPPPRFEDLLVEVERANRKFEHDGIAVSLCLHRHGGRTILQIVDRRRGAAQLRHFRLLEEETIRQIIRDLTEETGVVVDTTA